MCDGQQSRSAACRVRDKDASVRRCAPRMSRCWHKPERAARVESETGTKRDLPNFVWPNGENATVEVHVGSVERQRFPGAEAVAVSSPISVCIG